MKYLGTTITKVCTRILNSIMTLTGIRDQYTSMSPTSAATSGGLFKSRKKKINSCTPCVPMFEIAYGIRHVFVLLLPEWGLITRIALISANFWLCPKSISNFFVVVQTRAIKDANCTCAVATILLSKHSQM